jgi:3-deoxy-D-manno-octulosonic-acid transferase
VVLYLPLDTAKNARKFIESIKPELALFVKYEFWYHYLAELNRRKIPTVLFSGIFRSEQIFFRWYGGFFRNMLRTFEKIFVQNKESHELLQQISIASQISFDTRFDRVNQIAENAKSFPSIEKFKGTHKLLVAGSTWSKDEQLLTQLIFNRRDFKDFRYIIAPHNLSESDIKALQSSLEINTRVDPPIQTIRLSQLTGDSAATANVLIIDTMGDLSSLYTYGDIAYVGGAFNASVHNVLEPAVYGLPVIFGPNYLKSAEAKELIQISAAFSVSNYKELETIVSKFKNDTGYLKNASSASAQYVKSRLGGVADVYNFIASHI